MNDFSKAAVEPVRNPHDPRSRYAAGVMKYRQMGYWHPTTCRRTPTSSRSSASRRRTVSIRGGGRRGRRRVLDRDVDGRLDRPADRLRPLSRQGLPASSRCRGSPASRSTSPTSPTTSTCSSPARSPTSRASIIGNVFGFKPLEGAAAGGHALPGRLCEDLPGPADRHRRRARAARQVRPPAAGRDGQAEARAVGQELRPRGLRSAEGRPRFHQGRREHQLPAVHALARPLPLLHGSRQPRPGGDRRDQGHYLNVTAGTMEDMYERAEFAKELGLVHRHDRPGHRLHRDPVDVQLGAQERHDSASASRGPFAPTRGRRTTACRSA